MNIHPRSFLAAALCLAAMSLLDSPARASKPDPDYLPRRVHIGIGLGVDPLPDGGEVVFFPGLAPEGPAYRDGLRAGDRVKSAQGQEIRSLKLFMDLFHALEGGDVFKLVVDRAGEEVALEIKVGELPLEAFDGALVNYGCVNLNGDLLRTLATKPATGDGPFPAVLFIPSHPCASMDLAFPPPNAYKNLIAAFNAAGFATMRLEKSGVGDSHGPPCWKLGFEADVEAFRLALRHLKSQKHVDADRVVLFGHGYGGLVAARLAAEEKVRGVMTYGPVARGLAQRVAGNARRSSGYGGVDAAKHGAAAKSAEAFFARLIAGEEPTNIAASDPAMAEAMEVLFSDGQHYSGRHYTFWPQVGAIDPAEAWRDCGVPVLAVSGGADPLVEADEAELVAAAVDSVRPGEGTVAVVDGVDHLMFAAADRKGAWDRYMAMMQGQHSPLEFNDALASLLVDWAREEVE